MNIKKIKVNNVSVFIFFAIIICSIVGLFAFFMFRFNETINIIKIFKGNSKKVLKNRIPRIQII